MHHTHPTITETVFQALRLCTNLSSFAWNDDSYSSGQLFKAFLTILKDLPLRSLTIRTYSDLGEPIWAALNGFTGLHKIAIWCMNGPPRVLQGWAGVLGDTLTELELGVGLSAFELSNIVLTSLSTALRWSARHNPNICPLAVAASACTQP